MTFVSAQGANMSSGLVLDTIPSPDSESSGNGPRFRPYSTPGHHVTKGRYITSNDPRGYIPVFEYPLNGQWIMLDMDDGYVLWTGIWKALGNSKADIVKMVESQPELASQLRRVRGGYLRIQGTWMPYETALCIARRVAWPIRHELVPLFGPTFPSSCLTPDQPGYGQVVKPGTGRRRARRTYQPGGVAEPSQEWAHGPSAAMPQPNGTAPFASTASTSAIYDTHRPSFHTYEHQQRQSQAIGSPVQLHMPYAPQPGGTSPTSSISPLSPYSAATSRGFSSQTDGNSPRYSPYPSPTNLPQNITAPANAGHRQRSASLSTFSDSDTIRLPPLRDPGDNCYRRRNSTVALPPISSLDELSKGRHNDSAAVLRRLRTPEGTAAGALPPPSDYRGPSHREYYLKAVATPHHPRSAASTRLPPIHLPTSEHSGSSTSSPYLSPTSSTWHSSAITSPSSASVMTPLSARSSLDDTQVAFHSPLSSISEGRDFLRIEHKHEYK